MLDLIVDLIVTQASPVCRAQEITIRDARTLVDENILSYGLSTFHITETQLATGRVRVDVQHDIAFYFVFHISSHCPG